MRSFQIPKFANNNFLRFLYLLLSLPLTVYSSGSFSYKKQNVFYLCFNSFTRVISHKDKNKEQKTAWKVDAGQLLDSLTILVTFF